ncbi:ATP-dependent DNA helicase PIF1 [Neolecta irregularis DAH-3]|uniref:ATP-dependent DNA helicase n=1 Tax=Neolecta irregularis (strain DAH-3) TaxID=1198029 RepID=A0A1U7LTC1_NEOID|nr:ATP-dependent DNA helicase PIF1 [Neolecta irregularis DAH-3]|eukprot:OLL25894.1 ATP-dependent DNA helicase PIF1 [Neolecta irregularis DAH-3]
MTKGRKKTHYVVIGGPNEGIFTDWPSCKKAYEGFVGARNKGFFSEWEARAFLSEHGRKFTDIHAPNSKKRKIEEPPSCNPDENSLGRRDPYCPSKITAVPPEKDISPIISPYFSPFPRETPKKEHSEGSSITTLRPSYSPSQKILMKTDLSGSDSDRSKIEFDPLPACSPEQLDALSYVVSGHNTFITGPAGTGKSFLLEEIQRYFQICHRQFLSMASTGIAALQIGGSTLHSAMRIGTVEEGFEYTLKRIGKDKRKEIKNLDCLILDEVSMISEMVLNCVDFVLKSIRKSAKPFGTSLSVLAVMILGGIQMVVCGDFFQLGPVSKRAYCPNCGIMNWTSPGEGILTYRNVWAYTM